MNAGLSNLATLKSWLLAAGMQDSTDYDAQIAAIGQGVAGAFECFCDRQFARVENDTFDCLANRDHVILPRYPVEAVPTVEIREADAEAFVEVTGASIVNMGARAGIVYFDTEPGTYRDRLRITYTGGYYFEQLEPDDVGYPTAQPTDSIAVPDALLLAWRLQCEHIWKLKDKLGTALAEKEEAPGTLAALQLIPQVEQILNSFRRLALM